MRLNEKNNIRKELIDGKRVGKIIDNLSKELFLKEKLTLLEIKFVIKEYLDYLNHINNIETRKSLKKANQAMQNAINKKQLEQNRMVT